MLTEEERECSHELSSVLSIVLDYGDKLDNMGGGVQHLTKGSMTTRKACKLDLFAFLLYIAAGCSVIKEEHAIVLNIIQVNEDDEDKMNALDYQILSRNMHSVSDAIPDATLVAFRQADRVLSQQNDGKPIGFTDLLVQTFELFGKLMVSVSNNPVSESRYHTAINEIRKLASQS